MSDSLPKLSEKPVSPVNHIDYNSIDAAQMKSTKMQKPKTTSTPQKPKIQKSKATSTSQKPKLKKSKKGASSLLEDARLVNKLKSGRISAKEYREIYGKFLSSMILWNALPIFLVIFSLSALGGSDTVTVDNVHTLLGAVIIFIIGIITGCVANMILFIRIGRKMMAAQCRRINDLGWNGVLVLIITVAFTIISFFATDFGENRILSIVILLPCVLWLLILQGLLLFKKGQSIPNTYGLPCDDDN